MRLYTSTAVQNLVSQYVVDERGDGEFFQIEEGGLGWGFCILYDWTEHLKAYVIEEVYLNMWQSGHKVRAYNKIPKKYKELIDNYEYPEG